MVRFAVLLAWSCFAGFAASDGSAQTIEERLSEVTDLRNRGDLEEALGAAEAAAREIEREDQNAAAYLARLHWEVSQIEMAQGVLLDALSSADESVRYAAQAFGQGNLVEALYQVERGRIRFALGRFPQAEADFGAAQRVLEADQTAPPSVKLDVRRDLALLQAESGARQPSRDAFAAIVSERRALPDNDALAAALLDLAGAELMVEDIDAALQAMDEASGLIRPDDVGRQIDLEILRGRVKLQRSDLQEAIEHFARSGEMAKTDVARRAHARLLEATASALRGDALRAEALHVDAITQIRQRFGENHPVLARALLGLGLLNSELGRPTLAISMLGRAIEIFEETAGLDQPPAAEVRVELAMIFSQVGEAQSAVVAAEEALRVLRESEYATDLRRAYAESALGFALDAAGEKQRAAESFERALKVMEEVRGPQSSDLPPGLIRLAEIHSDLQGGEAALGLLARARQIMEKDRSAGPRLEGAALAAELRILSAQGDPAVVDRARDAIEMVRGVLDRPGAACSGQRSEVRATHRLLGVAIDTLAEAATPADELFRFAQLAHQGQTARTVSDAAHRDAAPESQRRLLKRWQDLFDERCSLETSLVLLSGGMDRIVPLSRTAIIARIQQISAEIAVIELELESAQADGPSAHEIVGQGRVIERLGSGEALLMQLTGENRTHLFWIDNDGLVHRESALTAKELSRHVEALRDGVDVSSSSLLPAFPLVSAVELHDLIFAPFLDRLARTQTLFFVPDGEMRSLPPSLLLRTRPAGTRTTSDAAVLATLDWLGLSQSISVLPSPATLSALRSDAAQRTGSLAFAGAGNPLLAVESEEDRFWLAAEPPTLKNGRANPLFLKSFSPLAGTTRELERLAEVFGADIEESVALEAIATEEWVRSSPAVREARVLAFATHGFTGGEFVSHSEPALLLTPPDVPSESDDGLLTASEIAVLPLKAEWVILSACNTAAGRDSRAEGLSGLASAFMRAGAESLLVSHWYVPAASAGALTVFTASALESGKAHDKAEALQNAMRRVMSGESLEPERNRKFGHPAYWAPFVSVGEV